jgi:hypothetical protein
VVVESADESAAELAMARIAALSAGDNFGQALTTHTSSGPSGTSLCASLCASASTSACECGAGDRFESCRSDHSFFKSRLPDRWRKILRMDKKLQAKASAVLSKKIHRA